MIRKPSFPPFVFCLAVLLFLASSLSAASAPVKVWEEDVVIPTYLVGPPDPDPMFYFGRAYQGARGKVYPYPLYDKLTGKKVDKTYKLVYLENEYVKIGVLPEIGGRIFSAVDKTNNYDFFYHQHVIKPALIGMIGAWISGGVEWNIPQHHRTSSGLPAQYHTEENADGSKTVWVGELELRHRMRWAVGLTLHPGKSYLETSVRILNRTPLVNTFLCFANVAVHTNDNYQVIFPPGTQYVTQHAKREFTTWPVATTMYGGSDFRKGVDVSYYKNHYFSNSMFAWNYQDDFFAGYDHGKQAGTMSIADHHIVPGKKLWTWGSGPGGRLWDKILTDEDGPYIELMVGAYSDNQPDYSWIQPYEVKSFQQFWYPFRDIGGVKNANLDAAVNLDVADDRTATVGFYTTSAYPAASVLLKAGDKVLLREQVSIDPAKPYEKKVALPAGVDEHDLRASISAAGKELVAYSPIRRKPEPMPKPVTPPLPPEKIKTNEELYLTGLRIEQFHSPALTAGPYWEEALRRDPDDVRVNTALGILYLKRARFADAAGLFRKALDRLTANYTSPKDGEPFYYLGVALKAQGKYDEAYDAFYKAVWSAAWQPAGYYSLAEIACMRGDLPDALDLVNRSITDNALNTRALNLKSAVLRHMGRGDEALQASTAAAAVDPLDVRAMAEQWLAEKQAAPRSGLTSTLRDFPAAGLETAVEYGNAGLWEDGSLVLEQLAAAAPEKSKVSPLTYYYLGYFAKKLGRERKASEYDRLARELPPDYVFPFQFEAIAVLRQVMQANPSDARAPYYLGNLLFDSQPAAAIRLWEKSASLDDSSPIVHRNLGGAYARQENGLEKAIAQLEKAVALSGKYPMHLFELDRLYEAAGVSPARRLAMLEKYHSTVLGRDDALAREIQLKVDMGKYGEAIGLMQGRHFNVWEGGARFNIHDSWTDAHLLRGRRHFAAGQYREALADYRASIEFPPNLQVAKVQRGGRFPEAAYWIGTAYEALGEKDKARESFRESAAELPRTGQDDVLPAVDRTVLLYFQALSLRKLGENEKAEAIFQRLVQSGSDALKERESVDFFSKFGEQESRRSRLAMAHYIAGLGYLGLNEKAKAKQEMTQALEASPDHLGAKTALENL